VNVKSFEEPLFVVMVTQQGMIKKTALSEFSNPRRSGVVAMGLGKGDRVIDARLTDGSQDIVIGTRIGLAIRFHEREARSMGRTASGVRAIRLGKGDRAIGAVALRRSGTSILIATEGGYGKRSETGEYRVSHRGGKGIITVKTTDKTGKMVAIKEVLETDDIVIVTEKGIVIRQHASEIRVAGRNTQGVRLIRLDTGDTISDVAAVPSEEEETPNGSGTPEPPAGESKAPRGHTAESEGKTPRAAARKGGMSPETGKKKEAGGKKKRR
jgi:DNA gyrase subunit A